MSKRVHTYLAKGHIGNRLESIDYNKMSKGLLFHVSTDFALIPVNNWHIFYADYRESTPFKESTIDTIPIDSTYVDNDTFFEMIRNGELK